MAGSVAVHSADGVIAKLPGHGVVLAAGTTVPSNGALGYATGCIFIKVDGSSSTGLYINEGTESSAGFDNLNAVKLE